MTRKVFTRSEIPADLLAKFLRSWEHTGGEAEAAICDDRRIISWHKTRKAAQSALSRYNATFQVR